jgi:hypothetical protein
MIVNKKALKIILAGTTAAGVIIGTGIGLARKKNPAHPSFFRFASSGGFVWKGEQSCRWKGK